MEPISRAFGNAFEVEDWAVELFAEEVVRGGPAFAMSLALSAVEPGLRASAELGAWQVISPAEATGKLVVVSGLHEVQDEVYFHSSPRHHPFKKWLFQTVAVSQRGEQKLPPPPPP